jgi:TonB family protein
MNAVSTSEPWEDKIVEGKYPLLELLGSGPRGTVFRTEFQEATGRQIAAIKLIPVETKNLEAQLSRLRAAMELSHPNLLKIFDLGQCQIKREPTIFVVTEYAEENLAQVLPSRPLTAGEAEQMLPPLIEALSYLHRKGLVHGRIQPSNVMAIGDTLKLSTDCVRKVDDAAEQFQLDKAGYAAPEASQNTPASDVWLLGVTLVAACATESRGQPSDQQLTIVPSSIPEPFRRIARECLRPNPSERCTLEQIKGWMASTPGPALAKPSSPRPNHGLALKVIAGLLLILAAAFGLRLLTRSTPEKAADQPATQSSQRGPTAETSQKGTVPGAVAERVLPNVSQGARNTIQGKIRVAVRVSVDATGTVTDAKLTSPGPSKYFANQALQSARRWKFKPPQVDGQATASEWSLKYQFGRSGTEISPSETR